MQQQTLESHGIEAANIAVDGNSNEGPIFQRKPSLMVALHTIYHHDCSQLQCPCLSSCTCHSPIHQVSGKKTVLYSWRTNWMGCELSLSEFIYSYLLTQSIY
mmetsp:Transcript_34609/g.83692  ORF Transcript_34609/g.83692 Transcript_34609/m.83692 type:complete len:102 (+) Transcript_34609:1220-1525(+)